MTSKKVPPLGNCSHNNGESTMNYRSLEVIGHHLEILLLAEAGE